MFFLADGGGGAGGVRRHGRFIFLVDAGGGGVVARRRLGGRALRRAQHPGGEPDGAAGQRGAKEKVFAAPLPGHGGQLLPFRAPRRLRRLLTQDRGQEGRRRLPHQWRQDVDHQLGRRRRLPRHGQRRPFQGIYSFLYLICDFHKSDLKFGIR